MFRIVILRRESISRAPDILRLPCTSSSVLQSPVFLLELCLLLPSLVVAADGDDTEGHVDGAGRDDGNNGGESSATSEDELDDKDFGRP